MKRTKMRKGKRRRIKRKRMKKGSRMRWMRRWMRKTRCGKNNNPF